METTKPGRRRVHDSEVDEPAQLKRKVRKREVEPDKSDSVQILGETHALTEARNDSAPSKRLLPNGGGCMATGFLGNHVNNARYPGPGGSRGKERVGSAVRDGPPQPPTLPPNPCESERMLFVQQWINSIRSDVPPMAQTSLTRVVPVTDPKRYPGEETSDSSLRDDRARLSPRTAHGVTSNHIAPAFDYSNKTQRGPTHMGPSSSPPVGNNTLTMQLCSRYSTSRAPLNTPSPAGAHANVLPVYAHQRGDGPPMSTTPLAGGQQQQDQLGYNHNSMGRMVTCEAAATGQVSDSRVAPVGRLFDDMETQMVVKLFRDYFTKGSCPILSEVRRRAANTVLEGRRTATSIRAKIKRLQTSGRWTDYAGI